MRIQINKHGSRAFYEEFIYIVNNYRKIKKNPNKKMHSIIKRIYLMIIITLLYMILMSFVYYQTYDIIYKYYILLLIFPLFLLILYSILVNKRIKIFMGASLPIIIEFNNNGIKEIDNNKEIQINWDSIENIIINKYSVCIIPKKETGIVIGIANDYLDEVLKGLIKYKYEKLLIDNSNLYK